MGDSAKGRYYMVLGTDLLAVLGLDLKFYDRVIFGGKGPYEGCSAPLVDLINYSYAP